MTNQKPVDDKDLEKILDDMFSYIEASTGEDIRSKTMRQLNAHFQKKYIGLIEKAFSFIDFEDKNEWIPPEQIREAIANIGGDLG